MTKNTLYLAEKLLKKYKKIYQSNLPFDQIILNSDELIIKLRDAYKNYRFLFNDNLVEQINYLKNKYTLLKKFKEIEKFQNSQAHKDELNKLIDQLLESGLCAQNIQKLLLIKEKSNLSSQNTAFKKIRREKKKKKIRQLTSEEIADAVKHSFGHDEQNNSKQRGNWTPNISGDSWRDD